MRRIWQLCIIAGFLAGAACQTPSAIAVADAGGSADAVALAFAPTMTDLSQIVPSAGLPKEIPFNHSNNNLDIAQIGSETLLAFRSAPDHFASSETKLYVVRSQDEKNWQYETSFGQNTDLREPRFLTFGGRTWLFYAVLGADSATFTPQGTMVSERLGPGNWTKPQAFYDPTFILWRTHVIGDTAYAIGYTNGQNLYSDTKDPVIVHWLQSKSGVDWQPVVAKQPIVLQGGTSETDFVFEDDGSVTAVARNEKGDALGFGSRICRAGKEDLGKWDCVNDPKKYDSPLMFRHGGATWLIGRRNLTANGNFDRGFHSDPQEKQYFINQVNYSGQPKRCALWRVHPLERKVEFVLDLPSRGDTCFASARPLDARRWVVYNYSSPVDGPDVAWSDGQAGDTRIYRQILDFGAP